jgi:hypothetical protein
MTTTELIQVLKYCATANTCLNCPIKDKIRSCSKTLILKAADKLEELQCFIDDMIGDHYVDYLEFYANRCHELEEELEKIGSGNDANN